MSPAVANLGPLSSSQTASYVRNHARPITGVRDDYDGLLDLVGDTPIVLLGEASHGTHEFYEQRAVITRRLIEECGFTAVAVEADWPDAYRVNRFVRGESDDRDAVQALGDFSRFPSWMWRNADVVAFVEWLRGHNAGLDPDHAMVGFYGLDLYSLHKSMGEVIEYLSRVDPPAARRAKYNYACLDRFGPNPQDYGLLACTGISESCRREVVRELAALRAKEIDYLSDDGRVAADEYFFAEQNARLVRNAEEYYREMFSSHRSSWNIRDQHMVEMLVELHGHLRSQGKEPKIVVWAHNSHLGDARATEMSDRGEMNIGELTRETFPGKCKLIGFTTHGGTVTAASGWHLPAERASVRPALEGSYEKLFHEVGIPRFWLDLTEEEPAVEALRSPRLERAIGVIYRPDNERQSHYFTSCLPEQFDAVIHIDQSMAVEPLDPSEHWVDDEAPQTFPAGT